MRPTDGPQRRTDRRRGHTDQLKALTAERLGRPSTLEDVFMTYTGRSLDDDVDEDESEDDD